MKPGEGKPHKDCAIRCILGGMPPVLKVTDNGGNQNYYLMVGLHGEKMNDAVQNYVATPVTIHADAVQYDDWIVLYVQSTGIKNYAFHGCGLCAQLANAKIDFDFGDNDRVDGFDAWRLKAFADSKPKLYQMFNTEKIIQIELDRLEQSGLIYQPGTFPGSSNYYWVDSERL